MAHLGTRLAWRNSDTVVGDLNQNRVRQVAHGNVCPLRLRVPERVGQALLNDPVRDEIHSGSYFADITLYRQIVDRLLKYQ